MSKLKITIEDLFDLPGAEIYNPDDYKKTSHVTIDSRNVKKGSLFVAIKGDKFDGHNFVEEAEKKGASAFVINKKKLGDLDNINKTIVTVEDTVKAFGDLANIWRKKLNAKVVSITGSNGKTTTKEILAVILLKKFRVKKTVKNNNNHIGVPLTIFSADEKDEVIILEHGTNHFGEIEYTAKIAEPDYALITNIGSSHLEFLKDLDGVCNEKTSLFKITDETKGLIFVNSDDSKLKSSAKNYKNKITFGFRGKPDVKGKLAGVTEEGKSKISITYKNKNIETVIPLYGESNAKNYLAAVSVALKLGLTKKELEDGTKKIKQVGKRLEVKEFKNFILIDDTYNSNPESLKNALALLKKIRKYKTKIAILGDMFELGNRSAEIHEGLKDLILNSKVDEVYLIGSKMKYLKKELDKYKIESRHFSKRESLIKFIEKKDFSGSTILIKGSRGMKMENFADKIIEKDK